MKEIKNNSEVYTESVRLPWPGNKKVVFGSETDSLVLMVIMLYGVVGFFTALIGLSPESNLKGWLALHPFWSVPVTIVFEIVYVCIFAAGYAIILRAISREGMHELQYIEKSCKVCQHNKQPDYCKEYCGEYYEGFAAPGFHKKYFRYYCWNCENRRLFKKISPTKAKCSGCDEKYNIIQLELNEDEARRLETSGIPEEDKKPKQAS